MERATEMVREYGDEQDFHTDEQKLGREGWSVQSAVNQAETHGLLNRFLSRFSAPRQPHFVVTYNREKPR